LEKYILDHNIEPRVQDLREVPFNLSWKELQRCYNAIDHDITRAMLHAECQVKSKDYKYEWSIALDAWSRILSKILENMIFQCQELKP
jgi:hypothetical protein